MHLSTLTENGQFDAQRAALVLTDAAAQDRLAEELRQLLLRRGYAGLDVDFEFLPGDLAAPYAAFLGRLRRMVNAHGLFLWAALAPRPPRSRPARCTRGTTMPPSAPPRTASW